MRRFHKVALRLTFVAVGLVLVLWPARVTSQSRTGDNSVPAYHAQAAKGALPETLSPTLFAQTVVQNTYALAAKIKKLLYQQPCYCHCDRSQGHTSLLDCFAGKHASECGVCISEGLYTYEQSRKGKTAAQIRAGIERGEWKQVDISKYQNPIAAE
jgi:Protein of unknown function with PCYCGC motif